MRTPRYQAIADELRTRVTDGVYTAGGLLPSESNLSEEFSVSRVTVRRALEQLREEALIGSHQGLGWYVSAPPLRQALDELDTIEHQLLEAGADAERQIIDFAFRDASATVAATLGSERVLEVRRLNLADGVPFGRVTVWCPEDLGAGLSRDDVEATPFYDLFAEQLGLVIAAAQLTIGAGAASADDAGLLRIPEGSPVLICERVTRTADGKAVLASEHVYPGHLTAFSVDIPSAGGGVAPAGLRLVE